MPDFRSLLAESLDEAELDWLKPHIQRDRVLVVNQGLDLLDVGVAIACDDIVSVQDWVNQKLLHKPFPEQLVDWNTEQSKRFQALIVQPYVLVQETV
jgi:hypothetical protein